MANVKKTKATGALPTNKKSKLASKNPENKASSTADVSATSTTSPAAPPKPSGFFSLPPELRNNIYRYALVSDEPIKVQFYSNKRNPRGRFYHFTMLPALATVSKQVRLESQRIFFEENQFETTPEMSKPCNLAPLIAFQNMHQRLGTEIRSLRFCHEVKKRWDGDLFQLKGCFTVSKPRPSYRSATKPTAPPISDVLPEPRPSLSLSSAGVASGTWWTSLTNAVMQATLLNSSLL